MKHQVRSQSETRNEEKAKKIAFPVSDWERGKYD